MSHHRAGSGASSSYYQYHTGHPEDNDPNAPLHQQRPLSVPSHHSSTSDSTIGVQSADPETESSHPSPMYNPQAGGMMEGFHIPVGGNAGSPHGAGPAGRGRGRGFPLRGSGGGTAWYPSSQSSMHSSPLSSAHYPPPEPGSGTFPPPPGHEEDEPEAFDTHFSEGPHGDVTGHNPPGSGTFPPPPGHEEDAPEAFDTHFSAGPHGTISGRPQYFGIDPEGNEDEYGDTHTGNAYHGVHPEEHWDQYGQFHSANQGTFLHDEGEGMFISQRRAPVRGPSPTFLANEGEGEMPEDEEGEPMEEHDANSGVHLPMQGHRINPNYR